MSGQQVDAGTEMLIRSVAGNPRAMLGLARSLLLAKGKVERACDLADEAEALAPHDREVSSLARNIRSNGAASWYFTMVQDAPRHGLYEKAFKAVFTPGCTVIDIGAGTGMFAMLAARAGASKVIACERDPTVAEAARRAVAANGFADRVSLLTKDSHDLNLGEDIPRPADILLWDNLANNLIGAGGPEAVEDAHARGLIKPGAPVIPGRAEIRLALIEDLIYKNRTMGTIDGIDLSSFNRFRQTSFTTGRKEFARASDAATIFDITFNGDYINPASSEVTLTAKGGTVHAIAQWVRFYLTEDVIYDTGEDEDVTAFGIQYHAIEPFEAQPGEIIKVRGAHDRQSTWFWREM